MKISVHKIGQFTSTKKWYVARLNEFSYEYGATSYRIIKEGMSTRAEAVANKKELDARFSIKFKEIT